MLTNLTTYEAAVKIYAKRFGIEATSKDCKTGGYNLEGYEASGARLISLIFLIALAMTSSWLRGQKIQLQRVSAYVCRPIEPGRTRKRHSNFWIGLYGYNWIADE